MDLIYKVHNGASAGAAAPVKAAVNASGIKTMLQVLHPTQPIYVVEWGISFDATAAATPFECELCETGTVAATVAACVANDITTFNGPPDPNVTAGGLTLSTSGTGYTATAEGTVVAPVRDGDLQLITPTNQDWIQFPLAQEFWVPATKVLRVRVTAASAANCYCYVKFSVG